MSSFKPGSSNGAWPWFNFATFATSKSRPTTEKCFAQHAAVTLPRCQRPRTVTFILCVAARVVDPLVLLQPLERAPDDLFTRQRGFPAGAADFLCVEKNERVVADPAAAAAGVFEFWFQAECAADVADGIVDLNIFVRAEVADFHAVLRGFRRAEIHDVQHSAHTVLNVKITFPLRAVAENFQPVGVFEKLFVEIKNVAVRVAFAENGNETENVALEFEAFAVGRNHAFAGNLGRSV